MKDSVFNISLIRFVHSLFLNPLSMMTHDYAEGIGLLNIIILLTHLTRLNTILIWNPVGLNLIIPRRLTVQVIIRIAIILSLSFENRFVSSAIRYPIEISIFNAPQDIPSTSITTIFRSTRIIYCMLVEIWKIKS